MDGRNCRLRRRKIGGAYLHGGGAQRESCRYSSSVRDSSRRDHRNADGVDDLRQERKQAGLPPMSSVKNIPRWPPASAP